MSKRSRARALLSSVPQRAWPDKVVHHGARWALLAVLAVGLAALYSVQFQVDVERHNVGTVAERAVIAEVGFTVLKDAALLAGERDAAAASVLPTFVFREGVQDSAIVALDGFFARVDTAISAGGAAAVGGVLAAAGIGADAEEVEHLAERGRAASLESLAKEAVRTLVGEGVMAPVSASEVATDSIRVLRDGVETVVARSAVMSGREFYDRALAGREDGPETELLRLVLARYLVPSLVLDAQRTARDRTLARDAVPALEARVLEGEAIVRANEQVGLAEVRKLDAYRAQLRAEGISSGAVGVFGVLGGLLLNAVLLTVFGALAFLHRPDVYHSLRSVLSIAGIFALYFAAAFFVVRQELPPATLPIVFAAVSLAALWDGRFALLAVFVLAALTAVQGPFASVEIFVILLGGGAAAALSVRTFRRLAQTWVFIAFTAGGYALVILGLELQDSDLAFWATLGAALASAVVSAILAVGFVPVFEKATGIVTEQTLIGWADTDRPLMRRLAEEAPGTYSHTREAANMAEAGADAIGANGPLCKAGVHYHDVGKLFRPGYFVENQREGNPHDELDPRQSAEIVRDHVVEGVRLARRANLPEALVDFIREHHGDQSISFFLERARQRAEAEGEDPPDPDLFRYPGPRPRSRETAIAMLADSCESAARALRDPTEKRIAALVNGIFAAKVRDGQLDDSALTLRDLALLKRRFVRFLAGSHHRRIPYPTTRTLTEGEGIRDAGHAAADDSR